MKVLMFGWKFPPHISGGLGTACYGLTRSLTKANTQILLVIPKADRENTEERLKIISASDIDVPVSSMPKRNIEHEQEDCRTEGVLAIEDFEVIWNNAELPPYIAQDVLSEPVSLTTWNYQFCETRFLSSSPYLTTDQTNEPVSIRYQFSGGYGPNLLDEVAAYGVAGAEIARQNNFDIIHAHDWLTFAAGIAAKKISGKPLVVHVHATEFDRAGNNINMAIFNREGETMDAADRVIAVSQWTKNIIISKYSISAEKIWVVYNGAQSANQVSNIKPPPNGKQIITFLGRITYQKGPEYFVDAARKVALAASHDIIAEVDDFMCVEKTYDVQHIDDIYETLTRVSDGEVKNVLDLL